MGNHHARFRVCTQDQCDLFDTGDDRGWSHPLHASPRVALEKHATAADTGGGGQRWNGDLFIAAPCGGNVQPTSAWELACPLSSISSAHQGREAGDLHLVVDETTKGEAFAGLGNKFTLRFVEAKGCCEFLAACSAHKKKKKRAYLRFKAVDCAQLIDPRAMQVKIGGYGEETI